MAAKAFYSKSEDDLMLSEIKRNNRLSKETFKCWSDLWPGFFNGLERQPYALFIHCVRLAKRESVYIVLESQPPRPNRRKREPKGKKIRFSDQVNIIIQNEAQKAINRATGKIVDLVRVMAEENTDLKNQLRELRPYKNIVDTKYAFSVMR